MNDIVLFIEKLKEYIEERNKRFISEFMNESKPQGQSDFIRIQQGLIANKKLLLKIEELTEKKEE